MYSEIPFLDRFQAAKDDDFEYVEFWSWIDKDLDAVKAAAEKAGIGILASTVTRIIRSSTRPTRRSISSF